MHSKPASQRGFKSGQWILNLVQESKSLAQSKLKLWSSVKTVTYTTLLSLSKKPAEFSDGPCGELSICMCVVVGGLVAPELDTEKVLAFFSRKSRNLQSEEN